jgi:hypothetical protein
MWPYAVWYALKSPWSDIWGNCVIFTVKPQCNNWQEHNEKKKDRDNPNAVYEDFVDAVRDSWVCKQSTKWPFGPYTPFDLYNFSSTYHWEVARDPMQSARDWFEQNVNVNGWSNYDVDYFPSKIWPINLERTAYLWPDDDTDRNRNQIFIWDVDILW